MVRKFPFVTSPTLQSQGQEGQTAQGAHEVTGIQGALQEGSLCPQEAIGTHYHPSSLEEEQVCSFVLREIEACGSVLPGMKGYDSSQAQKRFSHPPRLGGLFSLSPFPPTP